MVRADKNALKTFKVHAALLKYIKNTLFFTKNKTRRLSVFMDLYKFTNRKASILKNKPYKR